MATCLRGGCRAPEPQAPAESDADARLQQRQRALQSAIQRSAAPGRVADDYSFGHTLGASMRPHGSAGRAPRPWGYALGNAPPASVLRPAMLPCLGPSAQGAVVPSTAATGVAATKTRGRSERSGAPLLRRLPSAAPHTFPRGSLSATFALGTQLK